MTNYWKPLVPATTPTPTLSPGITSNSLLVEKTISYLLPSVNQPHFAEADVLMCSQTRRRNLAFAAFIVIDTQAGERERGTCFSCFLFPVIAHCAHHIRDTCHVIGRKWLTNFNQQIEATQLTQLTQEKGGERGGERERGTCFSCFLFPVIAHYAHCTPHTCHVKRLRFTVNQF